MIAAEKLRLKMWQAGGLIGNVFYLDFAPSLVSLE
jgi:hypothetical protein